MDHNASVVIPVGPVMLTVNVQADYSWFDNFEDELTGPLNG